MATIKKTYRLLSQKKKRQEKKRKIYNLIRFFPFFFSLISLVHPLVRLISLPKTDWNFIAIFCLALLSRAQNCATLLCLPLCLSKDSPPSRDVYRRCKTLATIKSRRVSRILQHRPTADKISALSLSLSLSLPLTLSDPDLNFTKEVDSGKSFSGSFFPSNFLNFLFIFYSFEIKKKILEFFPCFNEK